MKHFSGFLLFIIVFISCNKGTYQDENIRYAPVNLSGEEKRTLDKSMEVDHRNYDASMMMVTKKIEGYNYHTDADSGLFHEVRRSFSYAVGLLDVGGRKYRKRAFDIIKKTITLQDTVRSSPTCGVWPYYLEEPLATKKSPVDYNWADFNAVSLLEVYMGHYSEIPDELRPIIRNSLILAALSIQKRNMGPGYTNIAIMGTYVTYITAHLFDIPDMKEYAKKRLKRFYDYTLEKDGFSEYNSPTYTVIALDELLRMRQHITDPESKAIIDSLYYTGWYIIARHYHIPTGQWVGPHSRSYSSLVRDSFYGLLNQASDGQVVIKKEAQPENVKVRHEMPSSLVPFFLTLVYPRFDSEVFESVEPKITGTSYMTDKYAISSANRSSLWNQRRPFLVYWGSVEKPYYLQLRFLHDMYDFSSACFYSEQKDNRILAAINFITNGGDKHINIDIIKDGKITAEDLRLRFEFGNCNLPENFNLPTAKDDPFLLMLNGMRFDFQLFASVFDKNEGYWEKGGEGNVSWIDFVVYKGDKKEIDLTKTDKAILGFTFSAGTEEERVVTDQPSVSLKDNSMEINWNDMSLNVPVKPGLQPKNL
jgi:hypothetical protein